jgi:hypothetical protein
MFRKRYIQALSRVVLISPLMLAPLSNVEAGNPEPPSGAEQIVGPAIDAVFTAVPSGINALVSVSGSCKKLAVSFGPFALPLPVGGFPAITADSIEDLRFRGSAPAGCFSPGGGEDLIVTSVTKFNNNGFVAGANISVSVVKPK